jgi:hypothetical protein
MHALRLTITGVEAAIRLETTRSQPVLIGQDMMSSAVVTILEVGTCAKSEIAAAIAGVGRAGPQLVGLPLTSLLVGNRHAPRYQEEGLAVVAVEFNWRFPVHLTDRKRRTL